MAGHQFAAIVLAGGKSTRLQRDKASEPLLGVPLLQHVFLRLDGLVSEYVVVKANGQVLPDVEASAPITVVDDLYPEKGPLGGLFTGLGAMKSDAAIAVACDMPLLDPDLVEHLFRLFPGHDVVVPVSEDYPQPLCAVYSKACAGPIRQRLESGQLKLMSFYEDVDVLEVPPETWRRFDAQGYSFQNLNHEEDLQRAESILREALGEDEDEGYPGPRCEIWYGNRQCRRPATHRTQHSQINVCSVDAAVWSHLYEEKG